MTGSHRPPYRDKRTERIGKKEGVKAFTSFERQATKRPNIPLDASNHFEALGGDRDGQFSIRINGQWRPCFEWPDDAPQPVNIEMVDED